MRQKHVDYGCYLFNWFIIIYLSTANVVGGRESHNLHAFLSMGKFWISQVYLQHVPEPFLATPRAFLFLPWDYLKWLQSCSVLQVCWVPPYHISYPLINPFNLKAENHGNVLYVKLGEIVSTALEGATGKNVCLWSISKYVHRLVIFTHYLF